MLARPFTLLLCTVSTLLFLLASESQNYYLNTEANGISQWIGLVLGHWMHADLNHLIWNLGAFFVLGTVIEKHSRRLLFLSLLLGTVSVNTLLLSNWSEVVLYCGLSGVLNTLLVAALYLVWKDTRSNWTWLIFLAALAKVISELTASQSIFSQTTWPPYPEAHLAGMVGGMAMVLIWVGVRQTFSNTKTGDLKCAVSS